MFCLRSRAEEAIRKTTAGDAPILEYSGALFSCYISAPSCGHEINFLSNQKPPNSDTT